MANAVETLASTAEIKSPADKFFNFFKYNMSDLVKIFPAAFAGVELLEGEEGTVGCVKLYNYIIGGIPMVGKLRTSTIDDGGKTLKFVVVEGDLLQLYKSFTSTISVDEGLVKFNMDFEKASPLSPAPEVYVPVALMMFNLVDAYLLIN